MYLIDTNAISEARKGVRANPGVRRFFDNLAREGAPIYLSAVTIGEIHRGSRSSATAALTIKPISTILG